MHKALKKIMLIRNFDAENLLENFLIATVSTIIFIRFFLFVTDYPEIGGRELHIAHMVWGGLFMLIAFLLLFAYMGKGTQKIAAVIAGIGFGTFLDEIGKYLTRDNNYFFQPAISIMYIILVVLFLLSRRIDTYRNYTPKEYLINAVEYFKEALMNDLDDEEKKRAMTYLKNAGRRSKLVLAVQDLFNQVGALPQDEPNIFEKVRIYIRDRYVELAKNPLFNKVIIALFVLNAFATLVTVFFAYPSILLLFYILIALYLLIMTVIRNWKHLFTLKRMTLSFVLAITIIASIVLFRTDIDIPRLGFYDWGAYASSLVASVFVIIGVYNMPKSKIKAYGYFKTSLLISIFFTQVFLFYKSQFFALSGLVGNLIILFVIDYLLSQEHARAAREAVAAEE